MLLALQFLGKDKEGHGGVVINIGSAQSFRPQISTPIYCASKHAILALSKSCGVIIICNSIHTFECVAGAVCV